MSEHDELQDKLKSRIEKFNKINDKKWCINKEEHMDPQVTVGSRLIDITIRTQGSEMYDYAIEIKTSSSSRYRVFHQLRDYLIGGYRPILVAPKTFLKKTLPRNQEITISWILEHLDTSFVAVVRSNTINFQLIEDRLGADNSLRTFFETQDKKRAE